MKKNRTPKKATPNPTQPAQTARKQGGGRLRPKAARWLTYGLGFLALLLLLTWGYGDVLTRAEQDSYISTSPDTMHYLLARPWGSVYWYSRWALLPFKFVLLGGTLLALVYTLTARLTDYALRLPRRWEGLGFVVPLAQVAWIVSRGVNLYYKHEPSLFVLLAFAALALSALAAGAVWAAVRRRPRSLPAAVRPYGLAVALALTGGTLWAARSLNENEILTARLQNLAAEQRWDEMVEEAQAARRPTRAVAVYHAIGLLQTDRLLDGMFDIAYDFPQLRVDTVDGNEEYGLFQADANYYAGLLNAGYRCAMDHTVMNGPRLYYLKRMAACALLNDEKELCRKYLALIGRVPFEGDFVEKYEALLADPRRIEQDDELRHVRALAPKEDTFEQNYQPPAFLGYNAGLRQGTDASLPTAMAARLYAKDLQAFLPLAQVYAQKGNSFPPCLQQAIAILALKQPELLQAFPQVGRFVPSEINSFLLDAKPYAHDRLALRHELRDRWLGTYVYYYYTENNDPDQVARETNSENKAGVN